VNAFHRKFVSEVRRCDEMERKLRYIEAEVLKDKVTIPESTVNPSAPVQRQIVDLEVNQSSLYFLVRNTNAPPQYRDERCFLKKFR
jgi:hypothetical protein